MNLILYIFYLFD